MIHNEILRIFQVPEKFGDRWFDKNVSSVQFSVRDLCLLCYRKRTFGKHGNNVRECLPKEHSKSCPEMVLVSFLAIKNYIHFDGKNSTSRNKKNIYGTL